MLREEIEQVKLIARQIVREEIANAIIKIENEVTKKVEVKDEPVPEKVSVKEKK